MMSLEYLLTTLIAITTMTLLLFLVMNYVRQEKDRRTAVRESEAQLSYMREHFEKQLYELNERLLSNDERWKEVNHLLLSYNPTIDNNYIRETKPILSNFFKEMGIDENSIQLDSKLVFVLTPFLNDQKDVYYNINQVCQNIGLKCIRGDENFIRGNVFRYILEKILSSRLVIANIDGRNPNVMYELGIAHAIGKPTILVSKNVTEVPFDIKSNHIILYKTKEELNALLLHTLSRLLVDESKIIE